MFGFGALRPGPGLGAQGAVADNCRQRGTDRFGVLRRDKGRHPTARDIIRKAAAVGRDDRCAKLPGPRPG